MRTCAALLFLAPKIYKKVRDVTLCSAANAHFHPIAVTAWRLWACAAERLKVHHPDVVRVKSREIEKTLPSCVEPSAASQKSG